MGEALAIRLSEEGSDTARLDDLTLSLRDELLNLDVEGVERLKAGEAPDGARAVDLAAVGALIVTLGQSGALVAKVVNTIREWLKRDPEPMRTVKVTLGDRTIELSAASSDQQERLIAEFIRAAGEHPDGG